MLLRPDPAGSGKLVKLPMARHPVMKLPCGLCPKIPKGLPEVPESAVEFTPGRLKAIAHYRECRAVGRFPDDHWVRRVAGVLADVEEGVERSERRRLSDLMLALRERLS